MSTIRLGLDKGAILSRSKELGNRGGVVVGLFGGVLGIRPGFDFLDGVTGGFGLMVPVGCLRSNWFGWAFGYGDMTRFLWRLAAKLRIGGMVVG